MIEVRQLHPLFVGEVSGVDLAGTLAPQTVQALQRRHRPLCRAGLPRSDRSTTTACWAWASCSALSSRRATIAWCAASKHAELADISNLDANNQLRSRDDHRRLDALGNRLWHSDASFREVPGALSMLFAHVVPPGRRRDRVRRSPGRL